MAVFGAPKFLFGTGILMFALFFTVNSDETCDIEIENTLKTLLTPQEFPSMQQQALRRDLLRRFQEALDQSDAEDEANYKRSISSLAQWGNLPGKRNLEALARAGYVRTLPTEDDDEDPNKRSLATLVKNGQLPSFQNNESKRGIQSLARNGELHNRREEIQELLDELYTKRNIGSLARNFNFPSYGKRYIGSLMRSGDFQYSGKRNVAALAREGGRFVGKRNAAALLRQSSYLNGQTNDDKTADTKSDGEKRNIAAIKAQYSTKFKRATRNKRETSYYDVDGEYPSPVYQNQNVDDYEELMNALTEAYPNNDKRFLGSVAKTGWFRPTSRFFQAPEKRHIGALARLGWLPTLRNVRRFNRSGRSTSVDSCRETPADGQTEDDALSENALSLEDKRFLLQPAVDQILLKKMFMHPRTHTFLSDMS